MQADHLNVSLCFFGLSVNFLRLVAVVILLSVCVLIFWMKTLCFDLLSIAMWIQLAIER